ncbi:MAG: hypothetical protein OJF49_000817 [Ktedonobacterales bacterium]|jgi:protein phosphatase|nr:MAG: hypothetical protein OJF49_000817 [Ktedonobacterales bacterium]
MRQRDVAGSGKAHRIEAEAAALRDLGILPGNDAPPFDIVGDVHGCNDELRALLDLLGYEPHGAGYRHPDGRRLVFVGDLVDRGPDSAAVLRTALAMRATGDALAVMGNHDDKFLRWLDGHSVRIAHGLEQTIQQLTAQPDAARLREEVTTLFESTPGYLILDGGNLVVTHGAIYDDLIGVWSPRVKSLGLYSDVIGMTPDGRPMRRDWGAERDLDGPEQRPYIVYGHNPVSEPRWVNRTLDLDTGCVYGGALSALRYPELDLVQVRAAQTYYHHKRGGKPAST